ncbi:hypothetical protein cypCar_00013355 [Cyprinus carpio]|nr:hypothetical protein cypCar_00013355 [Cyprinus carpio]
MSQRKVALASNPSRNASAAVEAPHEAVVGGDVCGLDYEDSDALEFLHFACSPPTRVYNQQNCLTMKCFAHRGFELRESHDQCVQWIVRFIHSQHSPKRIAFLYDCLATAVETSLLPPR